MTVLIIIGIVYAISLSWMAYEMKHAPLVPDNLDTDSLPEEHAEDKEKANPKKLFFTEPAAAI